MLAVICFDKSLHFPFLEWDDQSYILNDPALKTLSLQNLHKIWFTPYESVWYPLARTSHAIDIYLFGFDPYYHRLANLLFHIINGVLVFILTRKIISQVYANAEREKSFFIATTAALVFIAHPQHVEVVAWVTQRNELLATLFVLLSFIFYYKQRWLSILFFAIAATAKPTVVAFPLLLLILDLLFIKKSLWPAILDKSVYLIISTAVCVASIYTHHSSYALKLHDLYDWQQRLCYASYNSLDFILRFFIPLHLTPMPAFPSWISTMSLRSWLPVMAVTLISILCLRIFYRTQKAWPLLFFAYLALILPGSGFIMFGTYSPGDRYMYLASALVIVFIMTVLYRYALNKILLLSLTVILLFTFNTRTLVTHWRDDISLWTYTSTYQPRSANALIYVSLQQMTHGDKTIQETAGNIEAAVQIEPVYIGFDNLLKLYIALGDQHNYLSTQQHIIHYYPHFSGASHATLGIHQLLEGNKREGSANILAGIAIDPTLCQQLDNPQTQLAFDDIRKVFADISRITADARKQQLCNGD